MPKTDKIEYEKRITAVQAWIIDAVPPSVIAQQIKMKGWSQSDRHAYRIIKAARLRWIAFEEDSRDEKRKLKVQQLQNRIRGMSIEFKNTPKGMNTILAYEREISKLEGLYYIPLKTSEYIPHDPSPVDTSQFINDSDIDYSLLSDEVLDAIISAKKKEVI